MQSINTSSRNNEITSSNDDIDFGDEDRTNNEDEEENRIPKVQQNGFTNETRNQKLSTPTQLTDYDDSDMLRSWNF